jgi:hypothetical protein
MSKAVKPDEGIDEVLGRGGRAKTPRKVALPVAVGARVTATPFRVLAFRPELRGHPVYKTGIAASYVSVSCGFTGLATVAWKRWLEQR